MGVIIDIVFGVMCMYIINIKKKSKVGTIVTMK